MKNITIKKIRNIKEINAGYLSGESNLTPICEICHKEILQEQNPVIIKNSVFCSKKCEYVSLLRDPLHKKFKSITKLINHLIHKHNCDVKILEAALNSEEYKKYL